MDDFYAEVESREYPWPPGRADLHVHILFDPDVIEKALVEPYRAVTHRPGLAPVSAQWVHMTLLHGGPGTLAPELGPPDDEGRSAGAPSCPWVCGSRTAPGGRPSWRRYWAAALGGSQGATGYAATFLAG
ncbi:hypothetical protein [Microbispora sp. NBC_01389]|uniref:hypothetical protein n=1 Tax=Microbispora sp. NBC_01389 TaxID=2903584 RepID=UPI003254299D